ncbi:hypothetical protein GCM10011273_03580 [Asticcacaulis endophyticus]|uniref:Uncharacterized protein n=1 Tax=Asticcacaulis endophyticus TaxID=1395890 RepID=A0A918PU35_9CAUL|nr:hypothetical protein GCM10011273_03580 [Asticcacaulis endophyticus]
MEIISRGQHPEKTVHKVTCQNCKTIFEFEQHEANHAFDKRDGNYYEIDCPVCSKKVTKST